MGLGLGALFQLPGVSRSGSWLGSDGVAWERLLQGTIQPWACEHPQYLARPHPAPAFGSWCLIERGSIELYLQYASH